MLIWLKMGGYSYYVWPAYGVVMFILLTMALGIKRQYLQTQKKLQKWFKQQR